MHIDFIEPVKLIEDRIKYAIKSIGDPEKIRVNPDCGLRTRSREVGYTKLANMTEAVRNIRKDYS